MTSDVRSLGRVASAATLLLAVGLFGCGGESTGPATPPNPPSAFTGVANSTTQITLNWVLPPGTVTEVKIERSVAGAPYAPLITIKPAAGTYVDTGLSPSTVYKYQIQACNGSSCSTFSEVSVTTPGSNNQTALTIWNPALPPSLVGYAYTPALFTTGGSGTQRTWSLLNGTLPAGVRFNSDGTFEGTPTAAGTSVITVRVSGGGETAQKQLEIRIFAPDLTRFNITRMDVAGVAPTLEPAVQAAIRRWESIITGDLHIDTIPRGFYRPPDCGGFGRATEGSFIDDFFLIVNIVPLTGTTLGQANTCGVRYDDETSVIGMLTLNATVLNQMAGSAQLENVVFHEIGHSLGFGILWYSEKNNFVPAPGCESATNLGNPEFTGPLAVKAWQDGGKTGNPPVENDPTFGPGTVCGHWKKSVFKTELMTGFIEPAGVTQQVSTVTIASMADLGFTVDMTQADPFVPPGAPATLRGPSPWGRELWLGPGWEIVQNEPVRRLPGSGPRDRR
jgi:hypothetical protein